MSNSLFNKDLSSKPMRFALKESTSLEKFAESFRTGLFGAFYLLCQQTKRPSTVCMFYNVLEVIQMLAFPLSGDGRFPWANGGHFGGWYFSHYMRYFIMLDVGKAISESFYLTIYGMSVTPWVAVLLGLLYWAAFCSAKQVSMNKLVLKILRIMATLTITILYLPITITLLRGAVCSTSVVGVWHGTSTTCGSGGHIALIVISVIAVCLFVGTAIALAFVYLDRSPLSQQLASRITGRLEVTLLCCKTILALVYAVVLDLIPFALILVLLCVVGALWLGVFIKLLPHIVPWMNEVKIGGAAMFCWAVLCLILAVTLKHDVGITVLFGCPLAAVCAGFAAHAHISWISRAPLHDLHSAPLMSIWARVHLQRVLGQHTGIDHDDPEAVKRYLESKQCKEGLALAEQGFRQAVKADKTSGIEHLQLGEFYHIAHKHKFAAVTALQKAGQCSSALDVQFFVYQRTRQLQERDVENSGRSVMSAVDQVSFELHATAADQARLEYYKQQSDLFAVLSEGNPDVKAMERLGHSIAHLRRKMTTHYNSMIAVNDSSVKALRTYAVFLEEVLHDSEQSQEYLTRAKRVEDTYTQHQTLSCDMVDVAFGTELHGATHMDEHDAVFVASAAAHRLGEITSTNTKAATMLGAQRIVLVGRCLHTLFPKPISGWVLSQLQELITTGDCFLADKQLLMPLLTSSGVLIPTVMLLKEHPPEAPGAAPQFAVVFKPVYANNAEIVMCDVETNKFALFGATSGFLAHLQRELPHGDRSKVPVTAVLDLNGGDLSANGSKIKAKVGSNEVEVAVHNGELLPGCPPFHELMVTFVHDGRRKPTSLSLGLPVRQAPSNPDTFDALSTGQNVLSGFDSPTHAQGYPSDETPTAMYDGKGMGSTSSSSVGFKRNVRRLRRVLEQPNARQQDVQPMIRGVRGLSVILVFICVAIILVFNEYSTTIRAYGSLMLAQSSMIRTARMATRAIQDITYYNYGFEAFGPVPLKFQQARGYVDEFESKYLLLLSLLSHVSPTISEWRHRSSMTFIDHRPDGSVITSDFNLDEGANMFMVRARDLFLTNPNTWTINDTTVQSLINNIRQAYSPASNATLVQTIQYMADTMNLASTVSLATFLSCFFLLSFILVSQFIVGIQRLSYQNFSALSALTRIPKSIITSLKERSDECYLQCHTELDPDGDGGITARTGEMDESDDEDKVTTALNSKSFTHGNAGNRRLHRGSSGSLNNVKIHDNTGFALRNAILLTLPLVMVMGWFTGIYFLDRTMIATVWSEQAQRYLMQTNAITVLELADDLVAPTTVNMPERQQLFEVINSHSDLLRNGVQAVMNGGALLGRQVLPASHDPILSTVLTSDACYVLANPPGNVSDPAYIRCTQANNGIFHQSLFSIVMKVCDTVQSVENGIPLNNASLTEILTTGTYAVDFIEFNRIENPYFRNISTALAGHLLALQQGTVTQANSTLDTLSIVFVALFALFVFVVYVPMIRHTGRHVAMTQSLLLIFSDEQLCDVTCLRAEVRTVLSRTAGVASNRPVLNGESQSEWVAVNWCTAAWRWLCCRKSVMNEKNNMDNRSNSKSRARGNNNTKVMPAIEGDKRHSVTIKEDIEAERKDTEETGVLRRRQSKRGGTPINSRAQQQNSRSRKDKGSDNNSDCEGESGSDSHSSGTRSESTVNSTS